MVLVSGAGPLYRRYVPVLRLLRINQGRRFCSASTSKAEKWAKVKDIPQERVRNFSIISHIDAGKSSLADRLLEIAGNVSLKDDGERQLLDDLQVERERGITVKARTASILYDYKDETYLLNLIDTPGHTDFEYEVKRSLQTCQGALLLVDTTQGIQAQTLANHQFAKKAGVESIVPILTKLDLPTSDPAACLEAMAKVFHIEEDDVIWTSSKTGEGCDEIFPAIIERVPPPPKLEDVEVVSEAKFRGIVVDSWYDKYRGTICLVSLDYGVLNVGQSFYTQSLECNSKVKSQAFNCTEVGLLIPEPLKQTSLSCGQVGYVVGGIRAGNQVSVGDYISDASSVLVLSEEELSERVTMSTPKVFASLFPVEAQDFDDLQKSLNRLLLNDSSVSIRGEASMALGQGFRCGFLGKLHMEVFLQRLEDEYDIDIIATSPSVTYWAVDRNGKTVAVQTPAALPKRDSVLHYLEPMAEVTVMAPAEYVGTLMKVFKQRRAKQVSLTHVAENKVVIVYAMPWQEVLIDLHDEVKTVTSGFANFEYKELEPEISDIVKVDILINSKPVDALTFVTHSSVAERKGREVAKKLKENIKRQQFEVVIQAAIGAKIVARTRIPPFRKDVLVKSGKTVGGGDVTRKNKLLAKQKRGKKRMKQVGNIQIPQKAFMSILEK